jgi:hypothetical protein
MHNGIEVVPFGDLNDPLPVVRLVQAPGIVRQTAKSNCIISSTSHKTGTADSTHV